MSKSTPAGLQIFYDDAGGTPVDITQHVITINDIDIEEITEQTNPLGTAWEEQSGVGVGRIAMVELGGLFEDEADGPEALFGNRLPEGPAVNTRTFTIVWLSGRSTSFETILKKYTRTAARDALTKFKTSLQPTGAATEDVET